MIKDPGDYRWSSYRVHAFGIHARMWSPHHIYRDLGKNGLQRQRAWRDLVNESLDVEVLARIRQRANTGLTLGTACFREQVCKLRT